MALITGNSKKGPAQYAAAVIDYLKIKAAGILAPALDSHILAAFATGAYGNFPYYWQDPANLQFNKDTYDWINANLAAGTADPYEQANGSFFTNEFNTALGAIGYTLSVADQQKLNAAAAKVTHQQAALLNNWVAVYGALPNTTPPVMPIDAICDIICTQWAVPATDLMQIQVAADPARLLNNTPASGQPILPLLASWVEALKESVPLQNAVSLNNGHLNAALASLQTPALANGGSMIGGIVYPTYVVTTPMDDILNGLEATGKQISLKMMISNHSASEYKVEIQGGDNFIIPYRDFFKLSMEGKQDWFQENISATASSLEIDMLYTGVTLVQYEPRSFDSATGQNWFFMAPIKEALQTGTPNTERSGYKFLVDPGIDFSKSGTFGITKGCAIANYPKIAITLTGNNCQAIADAFSRDPYFGLAFLGIPFQSVNESSYRASCGMYNKQQDEITIYLDPPPALIAGTGLASRGWVLGVIVDYPANQVIPKSGVTERVCSPDNFVNNI